MQFVILCQDKPDSLELRLANRPAHLDYIKANDAHVLGAGPFLDAAEKMCGSMLMVDFATEEEAQAFAAADPYAKAGLFAATEVMRWRWAIKPPTA